MTEMSPVTEASATEASAPKKMVLPDAQTVTEVKHWTDRLFSFRVTRPASLRFRSGEFVMIGLMGDPDPKTGKQKPLLRAYSIASPAWAFLKLGLIKKTKKVGSDKFVVPKQSAFCGIETNNY